MAGVLARNAVSELPRRLVFAVDTDKLSPIERELVRAVIAGRELVCSDLDPASLAVSDDEGCQIRAEVIREILLGRHIQHLDPQGMRIAGARIIGTLDLDQLAPTVGFGFSQCAVDQPLTMRGARLPWLTLHRTHLPTFAANGCYVEGSVELVQMRIDADSDSGALELAGAYIRGALDCARTVLVNRSGPALIADDLKVDGSLDLSRLRANADCDSAAVQLSGALIGGSLRADHADLANKSGPALAADNLRVNGSVFLRRSQCHGNHPAHAAVQLHGTHIADNLEFSGAAMSNESGSALTASGLQVDGTALFHQGFSAFGRSQPAVDLTAARIGGGLDFGDSRILNPDGLALDLTSASVTWLCLPGDAICRSGVKGDTSSWNSDGQIRLDGFIYLTLDPRGADLDQWLLWLHAYTPVYATQPYQQLAAVHRAAGNEAAARKVLIAQQADLLTRGQLGGRWARAWHRLKGLAVGYGYQSWRALIGLMIVVLLAVTLGLAAGHIQTGTGRFAAAPTPASGRTGSACSIVQQIGLGLDMSLPAIHTGLSNECNLDTTTAAGQALTVIAWLLQGLAWALATLVIVGYTGLIRKI